MHEEVLIMAIIEIKNSDQEIIDCLTQKIQSEFGDTVTPIQSGIRVDCLDEHLSDINAYYKRICRHKRFYSLFESTIKRLNS